MRDSFEPWFVFSARVVLYFQGVFLAVWRSRINVSELRNAKTLSQRKVKITKNRTRTLPSLLSDRRIFWEIFNFCGHCRHSDVFLVFSCIVKLELYYIMSKFKYKWALLQIRVRNLQKCVQKLTVVKISLNPSKLFSFYKTRSNRDLSKIKWISKNVQIAFVSKLSAATIRNCDFEILIPKMQNVLSR